MNQQEEVARDGLPSGGLSLSQGLGKGTEPQATTCHLAPWPPVVLWGCVGGWDQRTKPDLRAGGSGLPGWSRGVWSLRPWLMHERCLRAPGWLASCCCASLGHHLSSLTSHLSSLTSQSQSPGLYSVDATNSVSQPPREASVKQCLPQLRTVPGAH